MLTFELWQLVVVVAACVATGYGCALTVARYSRTRAWYEIMRLATVPLLVVGLPGYMSGATRMGVLVLVAFAVNLFADFLNVASEKKTRA